MAYGNIAIGKVVKGGLMYLAFHCAAKNQGALFASEMGLGRGMLLRLLTRRKRRFVWKVCLFESTGQCVYNESRLLGKGKELMW